MYMLQPLECICYCVYHGLFTGPITTSIVFMGKFCIAGSFAIIYNYSAEMFPTVIRNTALGVGSMCARLSAMLTPLITLLVSLIVIIYLYMYQYQESQNNLS